MMDARSRALVALLEAKAAESEARARALVQLVLVKANDRDRHRRDAALVAALAFWFGSSAAANATELPDDLVAQMVADGIDRQAAVKAGEMGTSGRLTGRTRHGSPQPVDGGSAARQVAAEEPQMRANYTLAAAERLSEAAAKGDFDHAVEVEDTYLNMHLNAATNRRRAARKLDKLAKTHRYFIWRTRGDQRVEAECRGYSGRIFPTDDPPALPGAVHQNCRCWAEPVAGPLVDWGNP